MKAGAEVHLFERDTTLGGKIGEVSVDGRPLPSGPDAFLARRPEMIDLARSLDLEDDLITPAAASARIYRDGSLHLLPPNVLGIPATRDLEDCTLLSPKGAEIALADLDAPDDRPDGDESVGALVRRRLGDEVHEYLVDPLLGGINAGDSDRLSMRDGIAQIGTLRGKHPSLLTAAIQTLAEAPANPGPVFYGIAGGLNRLVDRAAKELHTGGAGIHLGEPATLEKRTDGWVVNTGNSVEVDQVIVTTPAFAAAPLIAPFAPKAAAVLNEIDYSSVALAVLILPPATIDLDPGVSGVLVPRLCGLHVTAVSFASNKWPALAPDGSQILRVSVGRRTDTRWTKLSNADLLSIIHDDLRVILSCELPKPNGVVTRWERAMPQYDVGHRDTIARLDQSLIDLPFLTLTGAWRNGLGLPACVGSGASAAGQIQASTS